MAAKPMDWNTIQRDVEDRLRHKPADDVKKKITIPDPVPAGNHLAHFIRSIHWNSKGMLPSTAGSQRSYDKYNTVTRLSFQGPDEFYIAPGEASGGFERKKEKIEDIILTPRNQIFNRWKVPERLVTPGPGTPLMKPESPTHLEPDVKVHTPSVPMTPVPVPMSARITPRKAASRMSREMSLPNIKLKAQPAITTPRQPAVPTPRLESRNGLQCPPRSPSADMKKARTPLIMSPRRSKTMVVDTRKKSSSEFDVKGMNMALRPDMVPGAEEWMKNASGADKKVIERVLKMAGQKHELENSMKKTLLPDAKNTVEKWMKNANEDERQVALNFFNSVAGGQLMGMGVEGQRKRLKDVLNTLEDAKPGVPNGFIKHSIKRRKDTISDGNLRYVRLLTPNTRENHWMHSTWHHLPEYKDDDVVGNWSSHYTRPHAAVSRHFVIHPDWG